MAAYYNEIDAYAAQWLRNLISAGHIAPGDVDERSIADVQPEDLDGYSQCHFFAGIGGWSLALRLAGWADDRPVWTGSCPCQPLSGAGQRKGHADERHIWPAFYRLIAERRPSAVFGEQVASADGREWLAGVRADLEGVGYAVGGADLCSAGVGSPNIRQRLYWLADAGSERRQQIGRGSFGHEGADGWQSNSDHIIASGGAARGLGDAERERREVALQQQRDGRTAQGIGQTNEFGSTRASGGLGDTDVTGSQGWGERLVECGYQWPPGTPNLAVLCTDGKARRFKPGAFPLATGVSGRVGKLRSAGNAINPYVAARFIEASPMNAERAFPVRSHPSKST